MLEPSPKRKNCNQASTKLLYINDHAWEYGLHYASAHHPLYIYLAVWASVQDHTPRYRSERRHKQIPYMQTIKVRPFLFVKFLSMVHATLKRAD
jgi:hypothetical protein